MFQMGGIATRGALAGNDATSAIALRIPVATSVNAISSSSQVERGLASVGNTCRCANGADCQSTGRTTNGNDQRFTCFLPNHCPFHFDSIAIVREKEVCTNK